MSLMTRGSIHEYMNGLVMTLKEDNRFFGGLAVLLCSIIICCISGPINSTYKHVMLHQSLY